MRIAGRLPLLSEPTALLIQWVGDQIEGLVPIEKEALKAVPDALRAALTGSDEQPLRCLPPNPRRLKGLANFLLRHPELFPGDDEPEIRRNECRRLLVVAYVYQFHHDVFVRCSMKLAFTNCCSSGCVVKSTQRRCRLSWQPCSSPSSSSRTAAQPPQPFSANQLIRILGKPISSGSLPWLPKWAMPTWPPTSDLISAYA